MSPMAVDNCLGVITGWIRRSASEATWVAYVVAGIVGLGEAGRAESRWCRGTVASYLLCLQKPGTGDVNFGYGPKTGRSGILVQITGQCRFFTKDFWVRQAMKGYCGTRKLRDIRRPVSFDNLQTLVVRLGLLCMSDYEVALFKAAFSFAFFDAFRISELVSPSKRVQGGLGSHDVVCKGHSIELLLHRSKTDQGGKGIRI